MIIGDTVDITWNNATKKWYTSKGYVYTKNKDIFTVKIEDILETSTIRVNVICDYCGKEHNKEYRNLVSGRSVIEKDCCSSKKCLAKKTKEINLKLYGVESCMQRNDVKEKVSKKLRTSFEDVLLLCESKNINLLSDACDYKNDRSELEFICNNHKEQGVQHTNFANIKSTKYCCNYGGNEQVGISKRMDISVVRDIFKECDYEPLFKDDDYNGNYSKLKFICNKHRDEGIQFTTYSMLQQYQRGCKICSLNSRKEKLRLDGDFIFNEFSKRGLKVLDGEFYENKDKPIKYTCLKHPGIVQHACYNSLKKTNVPCDMCRNEESISSLNRRFRSSISRWRKKTEMYYNYKCLFTGSSVYDVHHIYPFNEIIKESLVNLNIDKNTTDGNEIQMLKNEVLRLHELYGIGVTMHPKIHSIFHIEYGKDASVEDFENFKTNYNNGKYKELIDSLIS